MEQLEIEKMRQFYDIFPYPNRPFFIAPQINAQFTTHGAYSVCIAKKNFSFALKIWRVCFDFRNHFGKLSKAELLFLKKEMNALFPKKKRILLVGCGTDEPLLFRTLHPQHEIIAIDLSKKSIQKARKKLYFHQFLNVIFFRTKFYKTEFLVGNAEILLKENALGQFDYVQCFGVLHHQPNPLLILKCFAKRMRVGGVLRMMVYSYHGRRLERRVQIRYRHVWEGFLHNKKFKFKIFFYYFLLRIWQFLSFIGCFYSTQKRFHYLGPGSVTVADALMHPSDPGLPLFDLYTFATSVGFELISCEAKIENDGYVIGFEDPLLVWNKILEADKKQELLTNPILLFRKA